MIYEEFISLPQVSARFQRRNSGGGGQYRCPCHDDRQASLTISRGNSGGTVLHCHAGCATEDIVRALGLTMSDLMNSSSAGDWKTYVERCKGRHIEAVYHYHDIRSGDYAYTKIRLEGKDFTYGILQNGRFTFGLNGARRKDIPAVFCSESVTEIRQAIAQGRPVFYCEGEKDVATVRSQGCEALTCGASGDWTNACAEIFRDADVVILADNDRSGIDSARQIESDLRGIAKSAKVVIPCPDIPKGDISDYFSQGHSRQDFENLLQSAEDVTESAEDLLDYTVTYDKAGNERGRKIKQTVKNHEIVLEHDARFAGKIAFNEFSSETYLMGTVPWEDVQNLRAWGTHDDAAAFSLIQSDYGLNGRQDFMDAVKIVSRRHRFHPVRDHLDSLQWDGQDHMSRLLTDYLGAEPTAYNHAVMRLWMLGAVARVFQPGIKFDYCMILQGRQGIGKSTFLRLMALNDFWFNDSLDSLDGDRAAQSLSGSWIVELAELKSLARTAGGIDSVKRFITATQDKIRLPYERRPDIFLRQCVFAGTTNRSDFLTDETGNRRFLIVEAGATEPTKSLFVPEAMDDIRQAWAQAVHIWKAERPELILSREYVTEAESLQQDYMADDGCRGLIEDYLTGRDRTCILELWQDCLGEQGRPPRWKASEFSEIVLSLPGWSKVSSPRRFGKYGSQRCFERRHVTTKRENLTTNSGDCSQELAQNFTDLSHSDEETPFD